MDKDHSTLSYTPVIDIVCVCVLVCVCVCVCVLVCVCVCARAATKYVIPLLL